MEDRVLPHAIDLVGANAFVYASDIPHGDREWDSVRTLEARTDLDEAAKRKLLGEKGLRFYGLWSNARLLLTLPVHCPR